MQSGSRRRNASTIATTARARELARLRWERERVRRAAHLETWEGRSTESVADELVLRALAALRLDLMSEDDDRRSRAAHRIAVVGVRYLSARQRNRGESFPTEDGLEGW